MTALQALRDALGSVITTDPDIIETYSRDQAHWAPHGQAIALARPTCTEEAQRLARWASEFRCAIVPRGAGTGVSGGANASAGCVMVSFERMNRILGIDELAMLAVVQPGVFNGQLKQAARELQLWYPPDPAPTRSRCSAVTSRPTPVACAASNTESRATTCSAWKRCWRMARSCARARPRTRTSPVTISRACSWAPRARWR